jgi:ferredoxin-nitrite reductase
VRAKIEEQLGRKLPDGGAPEPTADADHMEIGAQKQAGLSHIGVPVPSGQVTGALIASIGEMCEELGADVRFTRQQNMILGNVPAGRIEEVKARLAELGMPTDTGRAYARSIACTSHSFCNYSVADTKHKLRDMLGGLTTRYGAERIGDLTVHLDGCPHACAQHWVGEIGLQGTTTNRPDTGERIEAYDLTVGGGLGKRSAIGRRLLRRIATDELDGVIERLVGGWLAVAEDGGHAEGFTFGDFCETLTDDELRALATSSPEADAAAAAQAGALLRVPGPLMPLVGGADEIRVNAATVGEALTLVAAEHPKFGETVLPGGQVDASFLVTVGEDDIRNLDGLATPVGDGTEISIVVAMSGG